jgi:alpha-L-fucosidase
VSQPTPEQLCDQWQASQSKFDRERQQWLARVERGNRVGPFRPDWASLIQYHTPPWYEEARFGIFIHLHLTIPRKPPGAHAWIYRIDTE